MKNNYKIAALGIFGLMLGGCTDTTIDYYPVEMPQSIADYEYLNAYGPLKSYIDRSAHPGFLLGTGVSAYEYINKGLVYRVTNANFDQMTAGNAMKYASVVNDKGEMDFSTVEAFVEAAREAGMSIYGHTLCWHAQTNTKYLNGLIADKEIEVDPNDRVEVEDAIQNYDGLDAFPYFVMVYEPQIIDGVLTVPEYPDGWYQFFVMDGLNFEEGKPYKITARIRGSEPGQLNVQLGNWGALQEATLKFTDEWTEASVEFAEVNPGGGFSVFQPGTYPGKLEIDWVKLSHSDAPMMTVNYPLITGGTGDSGQTDNLIARVAGYEDVPAPIVNDPERGDVYKCDIIANPGTAWDCQFFIKSNQVLNEGDKVNIKFWYRCDDTRNIDTQAHGAPGSYHHWAFIGTLNATPEWKEHTWKGTVSAEQAGSDGCLSIAFNLSSEANASTFYIDDVEWNIEKSGNTIEMTPEEKYAAIDGALESWIKGMMEATQGYVKAWDVVNEPLQDSGGFIPLKTDPNHSHPEDFYWQDYLGENYVRNAVKYARQYYQGDVADDLKLFINDYNLEATYNNNDKCTSLVKWIEKWESDGVTKIDGIGSQMHVTYSCNPEEQARREAGVVRMLEILANSGKLIRITELDMGIDDADGKPIDTADVTLEQHKAMGEYYKFIIRKYFEIIPQNQQYGICQWAQTDSPADSGWRANSPIGLWTEYNAGAGKGFQRKPAYGSFCEGLMNQ